MPRRCALGCKPPKGLHVFPNPDKFPEQLKAWVRVVKGQVESDLDHKKLRVCDRHFTERDRNRNNRLNALAVPSLFLQDTTTEKDRFMIWVSAVGSTLAAYDDEYIHKNRRVCHDHFDSKYLTWTKRLCGGLIPTLHMPGVLIK